MDPGAYESLHAFIYTTIAATVITGYDWIISLSDEIELIWNPRTRRPMVALVYVLLRYPAIIYYVTTLVPINPVSLLSCRALSWTGVWAIAIGRAAIALFSALRVYVLSGRNAHLTAITFVLLSTIWVSNLVLDIGWAPVARLPAPFNCTILAVLPEQLTLTITLRVALIMGDMVVLVTTWRNTYKSVKMQQDVGGGPSLAQIMLYNGSVYFMVIASVNILHVALTVDFVFNTVDQATGYVAVLVDAFTSVLTSHFILDLRRADRVLLGHDADKMSTSASSEFHAQTRSGLGRDSTVTTMPEFVVPFGISTIGSMFTATDGDEGDRMSSFRDRNPSHVSQDDSSSGTDGREGTDQIELEDMGRNTIEVKHGGPSLQA